MSGNMFDNIPSTDVDAIFIKLINIVRYCDGFCLHANYLIIFTSDLLMQDISKLFTYNFILDL